MTDHRDIEETLKQFDHVPAQRTKDAVMSAYHELQGDRARVGFWKRPVPLYAAAVIVLVLTAASFVAGQRTSPPAGMRARGGAEPAIGADGVVTSQDIEWRPAQNDLL